MCKSHLAHAQFKGEGLKCRRTTPTPLRSSDIYLQHYGIMDADRVPFPEVEGQQQSQEKGEGLDLFGEIVQTSAESETRSYDESSPPSGLDSSSFDSQIPPPVPSDTATAVDLLLPSMDELSFNIHEPPPLPDDDTPSTEPPTGLFTDSQPLQSNSVPKHSTDHVIGIDLGTTFSCVSVWENNNPVVITNSMGNRTTPSWVSFQADNVFVGEAARSKASRAPKTTIYDAKRMIGRKFTDESVQQSANLWPFKITEYRGNCAIEVVHSKSQVLMPEEISAYVLAKMKHTAEDYLGVPVKRAVVTVPAYFNDAQRQATIDAASIAGLKVERIINEPTSAALAYGLEKMSGDKKARMLLVYDLGGGTLDVTIMVTEGTVFEVKSTSGDTHLGGQDFDSNLLHYFLPMVESQCGEAITENYKALKKLRDACQMLKHNLSHSESATIEVDALVNGEDFDSSLTREKFVEINQELFARCLRPIDKAIADAGITKDDIDEIVLIGGSTRIARIQQLLEEYFPCKHLSKRINPDEAVAMGAAIQGANLSLTFDRKDPKLVGITLMDVTPMSLGIELVGGKMSVIIKRNTTIPYSHTRVYKNNEDYQTRAVVEVFEGEENLTKHNRLLGRFVLPGLPPRPRGKVHIPVTFTIDANGVLEVVACVSGEEGTTKKLVIEKDKGLLTQAEIKVKRKLLAKWEQKCREKKLN